MVAECFNDFFINVAKDIGNETVADKNHPSIIEINRNKKDIPNPYYTTNVALKSTVHEISRLIITPPM